MSPTSLKEKSEVMLSWYQDNTATSDSIYLNWAILLMFGFALGLTVQRLTILLG